MCLKRSLCQLIADCGVCQRYGEHLVSLLAQSQHNLTSTVTTGGGDSTLCCCDSSRRGRDPPQFLNVAIHNKRQQASSLLTRILTPHFFII